MRIANKKMTALSAKVCRHFPYVVHINLCTLCYVH